MYNFNRYYDPTTGRYFRVDPFVAGLNLYIYCFNNPLGLIDPVGLCAVRAFFTLQGQADFWAGFGDTLTSGFGLTHLLGLISLTQWIRSLWNDQFRGGIDYVNYDSSLYSTGIVAGYIVESYLVSEGLLRIGGRIVEGFRGLRASEDVVAEVSSRSGGEILEGASWHEVEVASKSFANPENTRFTQDSIGTTFKDGRATKALIDGLKSGKISTDDLPPTRVFEKGGLT